MTAAMRIGRSRRCALLPDAWVLDTTSLDAQAAFAAAREHIEAGLAAAGRPPSSEPRRSRVQP